MTSGMYINRTGLSGRGLTRARLLLAATAIALATPPASLAGNVLVDDSDIITPGSPSGTGSARRSSRESRSDANRPNRIQQFSAAERAALREQALSLLVNTAQGGRPEERANALEALTTTPARLASVAESALRDENVGVRAVAAMAVGKAKLTSVASNVRPLLQDDSAFVRASAIFALRRCGVAVDPTSLASLLFDPSPRMRAHAAFILGELGEKSAIGPLREAHSEKMSRSSPSEMRVSDLQIAEARIKLGDEAALADVRSALYPARAEDLEATVLAIQIVGQVKDRASVNRLIELTADKDPSGQMLPGEVRIAAAASLAKLGQPHGSYVAREYFAGQETMRAQAANLMGETGRPENLQILARMIADPDGRVRVAAASAIVKITDRGA